MRNYKGIGWIGLVFFLMTLGHMMYPAVWSFVGSYRYGWSEQQIGFSLGVFGLGGALVMGFVLPRVIPGSANGGPPPSALPLPRSPPSAMPRRGRAG